MSKGVGTEKKGESVGQRDIEIDGHRYRPNLTEGKVKDQHLAQVSL